MSTRPYYRLLAALDEGQVEYAVVGGFAVVLHGVPRMTFDLDIVVNLTEQNMQRLVRVLRQEDFRPRLPVALDELTDAHVRERWVTERNLIAFTLFHPDRSMEELDILLVLPFPWPEVAQSLIWRQLDGVNVPIVGKPLLRRMKLATGREKDRIDAELLGESDD